MKKLLTLLICFCLLLSGCTTSASTTDIEKVDAGKVEILNNTDTTSAASAADETDNSSRTFDDITDNTDDEILVIGEKLFTEQINYIYFNPSEYIGTTIQYEGMYALYQDVDGNYMDVVYRYGPGCCTTDAEVGFEVIYDGDVELTNDDWVEVTGTVEYVTHGGVQFLAIVVSDLTVKEERGLETVT